MLPGDDAHGSDGSCSSKEQARGGVYEANTLAWFGDRAGEGRRERTFDAALADRDSISIEAAEKIFASFITRPANRHTSNASDQTVRWSRGTNQDPLLAVDGLGDSG